MNVLSDFSDRLRDLDAEGRLRTFPHEYGAELVDFTSNDYLGLARTVEAALPPSAPMTSSASRLLASRQREYGALETALADMYGRPALMFNSGWHANTGCIAALGGKDTVFVADKLVHASIIDGLVLSRTPFVRFRHNDMASLRRAVAGALDRYSRIVIVTESLFSMDGDVAPLAAIADLRDEFEGRVVTYIDEAHAVGVRGPQGAGISAELCLVGRTDIIVGTLGKALASVGAYVSASEPLAAWLLNSARSMIFSTALPPACAEHSLRMLRLSAAADDRRTRLAALSESFRSRLAEITGQTSVSVSQIVPWIIGSAEGAVAAARALLTAGFAALPIRRPTVAAGTERIRFSLSAAHTDEEIDALLAAIKSIVS